MKRMLFFIIAITANLSINSMQKQISPTTNSPCSNNQTPKSHSCCKSMGDKMVDASCSSISCFFMTLTSTVGLLTDCALLPCTSLRAYTNQNDPARHNVICSYTRTVCKAMGIETCCGVDVTFTENENVKS